ncbi:MAG: biotin transporter BioY [Candidatus Gastranaerophilales bacterium]|nr:biotin transporter BioY [Candidatus Gastranaerophilales bacterium]
MKIGYKKFIKTIKSIKIVETYPDFNIGTIAVILLCTMALVIATFTKINLYSLNLFSPFDSMQGENTSLISIFSYIPQVPVVLLIAVLLGPSYGMLSVCIYIILGFIGIPVFSSGGGPLYFLRPSFGFILGFLPAIFFVANILKNPNVRFKITKATIAGVLSIHILGIIYLVLLMFFKGEQLFLMLSWVWLLSGMQILYDFIFGFAAILAGRFLRTFLSFATDK